MAIYITQLARWHLANPKYQSLQKFTQMSGQWHFYYLLLLVLYK